MTVWMARMEGRGRVVEVEDIGLELWKLTLLALKGNIPALSE